ncbi:MAG: hypothetical protein E5V58_02475 [Mesorhizobium sp.]|nr:MAG: hypothetical protein E5V58_02475 [Mesorhizobium sp.]TIX43373.1 MAG: hypothetical protein E5V40_03485 [Mesorhizobium sp.]
MDNVIPFRKNPSCVELAEACGEWFVRVVEHDQEFTRSFDTVALALSYAEGQRRRLGLDKVTRV